MDHRISNDKTASSRSATRVEAPPALPGSGDAAPRLPDYELVRELGGGGMGILYLYKNLIMNRLEALKVVASRLTENPHSLERFLREIQSAAMLQHRNIVAAYAAIRWEGGLILSMEYIDGVDLDTLVERRGPLPVVEACFYALQAARGLRHAHERGMVHRDIKPANLMLDHAGGKGLVKILDFGLAKVASEGPAEGSLTRPGTILGTPDYVAPEQIRRAQDADIRADIYSLGCTLYFLLAGRPPFEGPSLYDILQAHHSTEASPLHLVRPDVPAELGALVAKMMAKDPQHRFQTPAEVADALLPFVKGGAGDARVAAGPPRPAAPASPRGTLVEEVYDLAAPDGPPAPSRRVTRVESPAPVGRATRLETTAVDRPLPPVPGRAPLGAVPPEAEAEAGPRSWPVAAIVVPVGIAAIALAVLALRPSSKERPGSGVTAAPAGASSPLPVTAAGAASPSPPATPAQAPPTTSGPAVVPPPTVASAPIVPAAPPGMPGPVTPPASSTPVGPAVAGMPGPAEVPGEADLAPIGPEPAEPGPESSHFGPGPDLLGAKPVPGPDGVVRHEYDLVAGSPESYEGLRVTPPGYFRMSTKIVLDEHVPGFGTFVVDDGNGREVSNARGGSKTGLGLVLDPKVVRALDDLRGELQFPITVRPDWRVVPTFAVRRLDVRGTGQWLGVIHSLEILIEEDKQKILDGDLDRGFAIARLEGGRWEVARSRGADWLERLGGQKELARIKRERDKLLKAYKRRQGMEMGQAIFESVMRESLISVQLQAQQQAQQREMIDRMFRR